MKFGKSKLRRILSNETGIPVRDIIDHGRYENYGNKERLVIGGHTITAANGRVEICSPMVIGESIRYKTRDVEV